MDGLMGKVGLVAMGAALVSGCKVGPNYTTPEVAVPAGWSSATTQPTTQPAVTVTQWWTTFNDFAFTLHNYDLVLENARMGSSFVNSLIITIHLARRRATAAGPIAATLSSDPRARSR